MNRLVPFILFLIMLAVVAKPCDTSCTTVFKVVDCDGHPVEGATVTVNCKSGGKATGTTGDNGLAELRVCTADIQVIDVTAQVIESKTATCEKSPCVITLCLQSI